MDQLSFDDLLADTIKRDTTLISPLYKEILELLGSGISSALEISECLMTSGKISNERYSSNKPKAYPKVCSILDDLVQQRKVTFVEDKDKNDRIYHLLGHPY